LELAVGHSLDFSMWAPLAFFEKADAEPKKRRRIAGVVSTQKKDKQEETILQRGLDFDPFMKAGWFNDNHSKATEGVIGVPDGPVKKFAKGAQLPDGSVAEHHCSWAEGYVVDTPRARNVWDLGMALQKSGDRRLGFSIEGQVKERTGMGGKTVAKAVVKNIAVTHVPVGEDTRMNCLEKSLEAAEEGDWEEAEKALAMGTSSAPPATMGPQTGEGAGRVLTTQSLERDEKEESNSSAPMSKSEAVLAIQDRLGCGLGFAVRTYEAFTQMEAAGQL